MSAKRGNTSGPAGRAYLALIREFPLRPIRSEAELGRAIAMVDALSDRKSLTPDEHDYLLVLSDLIEKYEDERSPIPAISGVPMLRYLFEAKGVAQAKVAAEAGIAESTLSEILAGKRKLGIKHVTRLAGYFKVDPGLFLPG
ncbi:MAG TPA: helix-turn-helix domain-containing protein [Isosphaeraceae bacterium]|nr:helix-turn-helix domain-containing protein [Isosphaeraceae bacterium]